MVTSGNKKKEKIFRRNMWGYGFPAYFKRNVFVFFPSVLITEFFLLVIIPHI